MDPLQLDRQLCFLLYTGSRLMTRAYRPLLEPLGLTYPQYLVMLVLWEWEAQAQEVRTVRALGERLRLDSGTLTPLLRRLESLGLVERVRGDEDARELSLRLTRAGRALRRRAMPVPAKLLGKACAAPAELAEVHAQLKLLVERLEALAGAELD